ncbi:DNA repair metallo-beta-lactamase-domain-containing protein, partial [Spinellus fusiger]
TPFVVDAFSYGSVDHCDGYFLTHYHSDHYGGLTRGWTHGPIYCSQVTANLVQQKLKVDPQYIVPLPMDTLCTVGNVTVGLIDANHCPGSVLFLFSTETSKGKQVRHLHTGDFRAAPRMCLHPLIRQPDNPPIDCLYLDTTYMSPNYAFPPQQECIQAACDLAEAHVKIEREANLPSGLDRWLSTSVIKTKKKAHRLLVVVGTYLVGKERVFIGCSSCTEVAKQLGSKIYVTSTKKELLLCQENPELEAMITEDQHEAQVHVIPMNHIKKENLQAYLNSMDPHFTSVIGIRPTGWTFTDKKYTSPLVIPLQQGSSNVAIYGVPYSEHSSFKELESFVMSLEIRHIIPTVHLEPLKLEEMEEIYSDWQRQKSKGTPKVVCYPSIDYW